MLPPTLLDQSKARVLKIFCYDWLWGPRGLFSRLRGRSPKSETSLVTSSTGLYHRAKRWYLRRWLTSVILRVKQIPKVFQKARGAFFQVSCLVLSWGSYPLEIMPVVNSRAKSSKCRHLWMLAIPSIFGVRQIPEVFQKGHVLIYNAGYLHLSQI